MKILVTGGAGRLGTHVCRALLHNGFTVKIFDLDNKRNRKNVSCLGRQAEVFWGDITSADSIKNALEDVDAVVHMAGILPPVAYRRPELAEAVNVKGTGILAGLLKEKGGHIPFIYTSSAAVFGPTPDAKEPLDPDTNVPQPGDIYGETKYRAENLIRQADIDFAILRLTATMYLSFEASDLPRMFSIPLNNRIEYCHPDNTATAIVNALKKFEQIKGTTLIISGGAAERMLYKDMIGKILNVLALPLPPAWKFTRKPYYLDWYNSGKSQNLLNFQGKTFTDYLQDYTRELKKWYGPLFLPFMRYFVSPLFGKIIVRMIPSSYAGTA